MKILYFVIYVTYLHFFGVKCLKLQIPMTFIFSYLSKRKAEEIIKYKKKKYKKQNKLSFPYKQCLQICFLKIFEFI